MTNSNHNFIISVEVFCIEVGEVGKNLSLTFVTISFFHFDEFVFDDFLAKFWIRKNLIEISNLLLQLIKLRMQLLLLKSSELRQTHFYDSFCLNIVQFNDESTKNVLSFLSLSQIKTCATNDNIVTMIYKLLDTFFQCKQFGAHLSGRSTRNGYKSNTIDSKARLQPSHLIELIEYYVGVLSTLHVNNNTHTLTIRFVVHVGNTFHTILF